MRRSSSRLASSPDSAVKSERAPESNKRPRRSSSRGAKTRMEQKKLPEPDSTETTTGTAKSEAMEANEPNDVEDDDEEPTTSATTTTGPSAYELERLEKIRRNAEVMASLGLGTSGGEMRKAVGNDAAMRAKARGLKTVSRKPPRKLERTRESSRLKGKDPDGKPMEDPEARFLKHSKKEYNDGYSIHTADTFQPPPTLASSRFSGDVSMDASNVSADGTLRLRQMLGGLVGRHGVEGDVKDYELAKPDDTLTRLRQLSVPEDLVCKVVRERAYSLAWHPSDTKLLMAVGDKVGNVGLWAVDAGDKATGDAVDDDNNDGVYEFKPHVGSVARLEFDPLDGNKLLSTSYDGTIRRMDVEKGAFELVYANEASDNVIITYSHLLGQERLLLMSDGEGDVSAVDLRTNQQVWKREAHGKKANTVHAHPVNRHLFATASLDRSVKVWDLRNLGPGSGAKKTKGMKPLVDVPHFRSVNSAHFSPTGEWLCTVGQDDKLKLFKDLDKATGSKAPVSTTYSLPHNNTTGRWLTKFQASWDPKSEGVFTIGSMQKNPHGIHVYSVPSGESSKKPSAVALTGGEVMTSIQSVVAFHPKRDIIAGVNSSGRAHVFM